LTEKDFKYLFDKYFDAIRSYVYYRNGNIDEATDIAQDAFMTLWQKNTDFEEKKNLSFLYKLAGNIFVDNYRKVKTAQKYLEAIKWNWNEQNFENETEYNELKMKYENALSQLPDEQRTTFLMSRIEELTYSDIANRLNISIKAVEKRMSKALAFLNLKLKEDDR